jgi:hypothetical protein
MKTLKADFAAPWRPKRRAWASVAGLLGLALLGWGDLSRRELDVRGMRSELDRLNAEATAAPAHEDRRALPTVAYATSAGTFLAQRSPTWVFALDALEALPASTDVQPQELQVLAMTAELRARVSASGYPALLDWLSALNAASDGMAGGWRWTLISVERDQARAGLSAQIQAGRVQEPIGGSSGKSGLGTPGQ